MEEIGAPFLHLPGLVGKACEIAGEYGRSKKEHGDVVGILDGCQAMLSARGIDPRKSTPLLNLSLMTHKTFLRAITVRGNGTAIEPERTQRGAEVHNDTFPGSSCHRRFGRHCL